MSASRMPVLSPMACRPSARLTAVVDLPTPPLPDATAIMCLMPATCGRWPRPAAAGAGAAGAAPPRPCPWHGPPAPWRFPAPSRARAPAPLPAAGRAARLLRRQHRDDARHAVDLAHDLLGGLPQRLQLACPLRRHRDRERHAAILEQDLRYQPQVDDVALQVGTLDPAQALDDLVFAEAHQSSLEACRKADRNCRPVTSHTPIHTGRRP